MGAFKRKLKDGYKWRYQGYFRGQRYTGPAIYDSKQDALEAERVYLASLKGDSLQALKEEYLSYLKVNTTDKGYQRHSGRVIERFIEHVGSPSFPVKDVTRAMVEKFKVTRSKTEGEHSVNYALRILKAFVDFQFI